MRSLLMSTAPFWIGLFFLICGVIFIALILADEYAHRCDAREAHRRQTQAYRSEGMA